jgi:hypothetical protein
MSDQYPHQPQPGWGTPAPEPPGKKRRAAKVLGIVGGVIVLLVIISVASGGGDDKASISAPASSSAATPAKSGARVGAKAQDTADDKPEKRSAAETVVFKVWGRAPAGAEITYGGDSDNRQGRGLPFTRTLPIGKDALYFDVTAQLQGSGDIHCSVTIDGRTKTGHASGGYNICSAQLSGGLFGGWS